MNFWLLFIPIFSGVIGWLAMATACRILIRNIIPSRQSQLAQQIGRAVSSRFSFADIQNKITDPENVKKILPLVEDHIDDFLRNKLKQKMPVVGMLIGNKTIDSLKEVFLKEIEELFPAVLKQFSGNIESQVNIESMVTDKITNVSPVQLKQALSPAFRYFMAWGLITGLVIGILNVLLIAFVL